MVLTRAQRAKRLIRWLSCSQDEDQILTHSATPLIRYTLLHNYHRCVQVSVNLADNAEPVLPCLIYHEMPKFLKSQLEAQKIADRTSLWTQVEPVLGFIEANLAKPHRPRGFPTLFLWYSRENHRSYIFFAFVSVKMSSKTYTARELLRMRHVPAERELYHRLYNKLQKDLELSDIVRMRPERSLPLIKEESRDTSTGSDDHVPHKLASVRQLDGTDSDWKYRGRTESENAEPQPISAPTGLAAQKDEGFQRFYKAVVSPTHVRVTAGGRIVPNTRGSSSPTGKWPKERAMYDGSSTSRPPSREQAEHMPFPISQAAYGPFGPLFPAFAPGLAPGMSGPAPYPMMPWHMGLNMASFGMAPPSFPQTAFGPRTSPTKANDSTKSDRQSDAGTTETEPRVRVSPPENFDQVRPFYFNGQWMMPPSGAFYPYGMPPLHGIPAPHMGGPPMMQHPMAFNLGPQPQEPNVSQPVPPPAPLASSSSGSAMPSFAPTSNNPVSSIRPSEITRKQIEVLRGSLRYLEDQLQYNKHQIDEKATEQQARMVRQQIEQFEKNLEGHLAVEHRHSRSERNQDGSSSSFSQAIVPSKPSSVAETKPESQGHSVTGSHEKSAQLLSRGEGVKERNSSRFSSTINSSKSASGLVMAGHTFESPKAARLKKSSSLPFRAALAPPFQPRSETTIPIPAVTYTADYGFPNGDSMAHASTHADFGEAVPSKASVKGTPYLIGRLPQGINPKFVRDTDYVYDRDLTEDELRARHMYWGKTPRHLQKGLPKFNGKDFYPPSPAKGSSSNTDPSSTRSASHPTTDDSLNEYPVKAKTEADPFRSLPRLGPRVTRTGLGDATQSESLPRPEESLPGLPTHRIAQIGRSYEDFRKTMSEDQPSSESTRAKSSSDEGDDDRNLIFKGRRAISRAATTKTHNEIWQSMLKKGKSSAHAVPVTISSMTAQGVLPNYAGHATASLNPTMVNTSVSPRSAAKARDVSDIRSTTPVAKKIGENRPPAEVASNGPPRSVSIRDGRKGLISR